MGDTLSQNVLGLSSCVIAVVGPTASGKSAFAQALALEYNGEVVGADSMQIYQGMDIGTGKLEPGERKVPHHGIDLCLPDAPYSVALYQSFARGCFKEIDTRQKRSFLCGGSGLYIRAAIDDYHFPRGEQVGNPIRDHYARIAEAQGAEALWGLLEKRDSESAALIHPHNTRRVIRAFEMLEEGTSYAEQHTGLSGIRQVVPTVFIGLAVDTDILRARISSRVDAMITKGLVAEVESLLDRGFRSSITAPQAIGYKEIVEVIEGTATLDEAIEAIKTATCRYAKRQRTWFRRDPRINWLHADSGDTEKMVYQARELLGTMDQTYYSA